MEKKVQTRLIKYLRSKGCYVIKTKPGPGVPVGCPDVIFFKEGFWGCAEVKATEKSAYQPLQKETIAKLSQWSWCKVIHSNNVEKVLDELDSIL